MHAVKLRGLTKNNKEIAEILDVHYKVVNKWISIFSNQRMQGLVNRPKGENHKNMTFEDEASFGRIQVLLVKRQVQTQHF